MTLRTDAKELLDTLKLIVAHSERYAEKYRNNYISALAASIRPLVAEYEKAIEEEKSKESAQKALSEMTDYVHELSGASTKGEMEIFPETDESLNEYWRLYTIFRELKYKEECL